MKKEKSKKKAPPKPKVCKDCKSYSRPKCKIKNTYTARKKSACDSFVKK